jgi:hypothetical protein
VNEFRWNDWNLEHATRHGVGRFEAERLIDGPPRGWPRQVGNGKLMVQGRGQGGRFIQVIYIIDDDGTIFIISAMPLTTRRRRSGRR